MSLFILEFLITLPPQLTRSNTHNLPPIRYALVKDLSLRYKVQVGKRCIEQVEVSIFVDSPVGGAETRWKLDK